MSEQDLNENEFEKIVALAMQRQAVIGMRPVIEKELLHYDILYSLDRYGLLEGLVFQGGTALRLCYGANRFSEDLDFAGGESFTHLQLKEMKSWLTN